MERKDSSYVFGFNEFATLQDFVNHFANQPLLGSDAGMNNLQQQHKKSVIPSIFSEALALKWKPHI